MRPGCDLKYELLDGPSPERGYQGASIYEIAERAGHSIGALYSSSEARMESFSPCLTGISPIS
jgi:AcrR family transcriptional regulator